MYQVRIATIRDIEVIIPLFIEYHQFYNYTSNYKQIERFLLQRITKNESIIFLCYENNNNENNENNEKIIGFSQIYPSFNSLTLNSLFILHDLFVLFDYRGKGIGSLLLNTVKEYVRNNNNSDDNNSDNHGGEIMLQTAKDNFTAQRLYESHGYVKDEEFYVYYLSL